MSAGIRWLPVLVVATALAGSPGAAAGQSACGDHYTVRAGDTLAAIAARCGVTLPALLAANPSVRHDDDLAADRDIAIPDPRRPQPSPQAACGGFYTVRAGDTLAGIAQKCGLTVPLLVAANGPMAEPLWTRAGGVVRIPDVPRAALRDTLTWATADPAPATGPETELEDLTRATGTLAPGEPCLMLRTDAGETIALAGGPSRVFGAGDRVVVLGVHASAERCGHAPTLEARIIYAAGGRQ